MTKWLLAIPLLFFATVELAAAADDPKYLPMPPGISIDANRDQVLAEYPLGVITKEAAFAHHGQAHNVVTLPNGLEGWVYEITPSTRETFATPSGERRDVQASEHTNVVSTYTLMFDADGKIVDVLYMDNRRDDASSALLVQRKLAADVSRKPWRTKHRENE